MIYLTDKTVLNITEVLQINRQAGRLLLHSDREYIACYTNFTHFLYSLYNRTPNCFLLAQPHHSAGTQTSFPTAGRAGLQGQALSGSEAQNLQAQEPETNEFLQKQLDGDIIFFISQHIGRWKSLGRCLGFTEAQMENIEDDHFKNQEEQGVQMLHKWVRREGANATLATLVAAAEKAQRSDVALLVWQYAKKQT